MTTQHTPGPWASNSADSFELGVYGNGYRIAKMTGGEINRDIANARLIAAAPELLKQLKIARDEAVGWFDDSRGFNPKNPPEWLAEIDAAIAKATNA